MLAAFGTSQHLRLSKHENIENCQKNPRLSMEEEEYVNLLFDRLYESLPRRHRGFIQEQIHFGNEQTIFAMAWSDSNYSETVQNQNIAVFLFGSLTDNPTEYDDAEYLLHEYANGFIPDSLVAQLDGAFFFIIFDKQNDILLVTKSLEGSPPLYWGKSQVSESVLFSTDRSFIESDCINTDVFPAGAIFITEPGSASGKLRTIGAKALLTPHLCRIESSNNFVDQSTSI